MKKNKKSLFIIVLLICMLSIGYALLSANLNINGTSNLDGNMKWDIHFANVQVNSNSVTVDQDNNEQSATINPNDNTKVSFAVTLNNPGDFYEFTVDAVNEGTIDGVVDSIVTKLNDQIIENLPNYLSYTITYLDDTAIASNHILKYNDSETYKVRLEYKKNITEADLPDSSQNLTFELDVNYKQADDSIEDTRVSYQVIHRYPNLDGETYVEVIDLLKGEPNSVVTPKVRDREGFSSPQTQQLTVVSNASVIYTYTRKTFNFNITDRTYLEEGSTTNGAYLYGTEITLIAKQREGYTFKWSDDDTSYQRTVTLSDNLNLSLVYTPGTDITYTVIHKQQDLVGNGYTTVAEVPHSGTVDTQVTPPVNNYPGFIAPSTQTVTINGDGSTVVEYKYDRIPCVLTLEDDSYINTSTPSGTYRYGTEITLTAIERNNYTFERWSNNNSNSSITFNIEEDTTIGPIYSQNTYRVDLNANGGSVNPDYIIVNRGSSIGSIPTPVYAGYYLDNWYTSLMNGIVVDSSYTPTGDTEIIAKWKVSIASANIVNDDIEVKVGKTAKVNISNAEDIDEEYTFSSDDTSVATVDANTGVITGVSTGSATITITGADSGDTVTVDVTVVVNAGGTYTITLNANDGTLTGESSFEVDAGDTIGDIDEPTREAWRFVGWYDDPTDGNEITSSYEPDDDMDLYARWERYICKAATTLHTATCDSTSPGCADVGYTANELGTTITFGNVPTGSFALGNAYNCDIDNDGLFEDTERFYYLGQKGDNAVLVFHSNFEGTSGVASTNIYTYDVALTKLPTTEQWSLINVTYEHDGDDTEYAARLLTLGELETYCNSPLNGTDGELDRCEFLFENTRFISTTTGRTALWIEKYGNTLKRVYSTKRHVENPKNTSENAVRPVIEVDLEAVDNRVDESNIATITFDTNGGSSVAPLRVAKNHFARTLPTSSKTNREFKGWYLDDDTFNNEFTERTIVTGDITVHAKWGTVDGVCIMDGVGYSTLTAAIAAAPSGEHTEIELIDNIDEGTITIGSTKDITLNLSTFNVVNNSNNVFINNGTLEIIGTTGAIRSSAGSGAINNLGKMTMTSGSIIATGTRQAIYNDTGELIINGGYLEASSSERATVHSKKDKGNNTNHSVTINGGTIVSKNQEAVKIEAGTLSIGNDDGYINTTAPVLQGKTYAVTSSIAYNYYDGILKGANNDQKVVSDRTKITWASNSVPVDGTEVINDSTTGNSNVTFYTLTMDMSTPKYLIQFNANGGTVTETQRLIDPGDELGALPDPPPTKGIYTFDGWYTGLTDGYEIDEHEVPVGNVSYYARWVYNANEQIVNYNMINAPMQVYYSNISTWKNDSSTFQTNMVNNFNHYNCQCTDGTCSTGGTVLCDKPVSYDTTIGEALNVYLYNETTETKTLVNYTRSDNGVLYNLIPGQAYYWEAASDSSIHGYVKGTAERRLIDLDGVRNVRDLGGLKLADMNNDGQPDGTLKYGILFRGEKLSTNQNAINQLIDLGVNEELDLRKTTERGSDEIPINSNNFKLRSIQHYQIDPEHYASNYDYIRTVITEVMQDVVAGNKIYFHCRIGADRTGTLAYILEGLLQVDDEQRLQDYELTHFFGLINRHRYYSYDATSSVSKTEKFVYMYNFLTTYQDIYNWYMSGSTNTTADNQLIAQFRTAMIN